MVSEKAAFVSSVYCFQFIFLYLVYECFCCCSVYLVFVLSVVNMGRWSELNVCCVCQEVLLKSDVDIDVMSGGDVAC